MGGGSTHPALAGTPFLKRCFTWGNPKTALSAPRRGFFGLGFDQGLFGQVFGQLEMSDEKEQREGNADGCDA